MGWHRSHWIIALALCVLVLFIYWASIAELEQVSRAQGQVIATSRTQVIQSANDGVIENIMVEEGERVRKGQVLVRLNRSRAQASYQDSLSKVAALKLALIRLQAEVFGRPLEFSPELQAYPSFVQNQVALYQRRRNALDAEIANLEVSLGLVREELVLTKPLLDTGDVGEIEIIRLRKQIAEYKGKITNLKNRFFQDAQTEMTKAEEDLATQKQVLAEREVMLERTELKAPSDGLVRKILTTTLGASLRAGDVVMELLPTGSDLIVEAKLMPADVGFIKEGLPTSIKLDAYDYSVYGSLRGEVIYISPDALTEKTAKGEVVYYRVQSRIDAAALVEQNRKRPDKKIEIQPGMTAMLEIKTGSKTVLHYLSKPITKTLSESMTER